MTSLSLVSFPTLSPSLRLQLSLTLPLSLYPASARRRELFQFQELIPFGFLSRFVLRSLLSFCRRHRVYLHAMAVQGGEDVYVTVCFGSRAHSSTTTTSSGMKEYKLTSTSL